MAIKQTNTKYYSPSSPVGGSGVINHIKAAERVGKRFGMLTVTKHLGSDARRLAIYECLCDCGKTCVKTSISFRGKTPSCGCYGRMRQAETHLKHGGSRRSGKEPIYNIWICMKRRCNNKNSPDYKWYGGKGIKVCYRWKDYASFREDMLPTYSHGLTIERKDPNKDYEPSNCEWVTGSENARRAAKQKHERTKKIGAGKTQLAYAEALRLARDMCVI